MTDDVFDDRYVRFREHADVRERVTALESDKVQVAASLSRIEAMLNARSPATAPQETAAALALHRALDAFDKAPRNGAGVMPWVLVGGLAALSALLAFGAF